MKRFLLPLFAAAAGCISFSIDEVPDGTQAFQSSRRIFAELDPGSKELVSLHFQVSAYGNDDTRVASELCERLYSRILNDTGLYSFLPAQPYTVTVYGGRAEYLQKTGLPDWSGGVSAGNTIYTYKSSRLSGILAHEMTHLIFREYLGRDDITLRWVNEGLAVYEEQEALIAQGIALSSHPRRIVSFQEMLLLAPMDESGRDVSAWYRQVGSVVRFMIERGGRIGFGQFMRSLKDGHRVSDAIRTGFPAKWRSLDELETDWRGRR